MLCLTYSQRKLALEYEKCDRVFVSIYLVSSSVQQHHSSLFFRQNERLCPLGFFISGTRNIFVM